MRAGSALEKAHSEARRRSVCAVVPGGSGLPFFCPSFSGVGSPIAHTSSHTLGGGVGKQKRPPNHVPPLRRRRPRGPRAGHRGRPRRGARGARRRRRARRAARQWPHHARRRASSPSRTSGRGGGRVEAAGRGAGVCEKRVEEGGRTACFVRARAISVFGPPSTLPRPARSSSPFLPLTHRPRL